MLEKKPKSPIHDARSRSPFASQTKTADSLIFTDSKTRSKSPKAASPVQMLEKRKRGRSPINLEIEEVFESKQWKKKKLLSLAELLQVDKPLIEKAWLDFVKTLIKDKNELKDKKLVKLLEEGAQNHSSLANPAISRLADTRRADSQRGIHFSFDDLMRGVNTGAINWNMLTFNQKTLSFIKKHSSLLTK